MSLNRAIRIIIMLFGLIGVLTGFAFAKNVSSGQPVSVKGFEHRYLSRNRIHMNKCRVPKCLPGSLVSYQLYSPEKTPSFKAFKNGQKRAADLLQKRAKKGVKITIEKSRREKDSIFTIFTSHRVKQNPNGSKVFTISSAVYGSKITISIISSSTSRKAAEANSAIFLSGLMLLDHAI